MLSEEEYNRPENQELAKNYYTYTSRGFANPVGWDNLMWGTRWLWVERAIKAAQKERRENGPNI